MKETQVPALPTNDAGATYEVLACETADREQELLFVVRDGNQSLPSGMYIAHVMDGRMIHYEPLEYPEEFAEELMSFWARDTTAAGQRKLRKAIDLVFRSLDEVDPNTDPEAYANLKLREESDDPDVLAIWSDGEWGVVRLVTHPEVHRRYPGDASCEFGHYNDCTLWSFRDRLTKYGRKMLLDVIDVD
jgi:hypothetical protein